MNFTNIEIVTMAVFLLGGDAKKIDTEDIAVKSNDLAPGRFTWKKYPNQINIDNVKKRLSDAKNKIGYDYLVGDFKTGWKLSPKGIKLVNEKLRFIDKSKLTISPNHQKDTAWIKNEKIRIMSCNGFKKYANKNNFKILKTEIQEIFRIDEYIVGNSRKNKIMRIYNMFVNDPDIGLAIKYFYKRINKNE
jgi:uncharacterized protein YutD